MLDGLQGALGIRPEDEVNLLLPFLLQGPEQVGHGPGAALLLGFLAGLALLFALLGDLLGGFEIRYPLHHIPGVGKLLEAQDLHGASRARFLALVAVGVHHGPDAAVHLPGHHVVPHPEGPLLDQHVGDNARLLVQLGLEDDPFGLGVRVGPVVLQLGDEEDHLQKVLHPLARFGADGHHDGIPAVLLGHEAPLHQLALDPVGVGLGQVHFVQGEDDFGPGCLGVGDGLIRLGHDPVVGGDDDDGDVRHLGSPLPYGGEGLVPRGVDEDHRALRGLHLEGTHVLGNASRLLLGDATFPQVVQEGGLPVVHVAHDHHHGRPSGQGFPALLLRQLLLQASLLFYQLPHRLRVLLGKGGGVGLVGNPHLVQELQELLVGHTQLFSQLVDAYFGHPYLLKG